MNKRKRFLDYVSLGDFSFDSFNVFLNNNNIKLGETLTFATNDLKFYSANALKIVDNKEVIHNLFCFLLFFFTYYSVFNVDKYKNTFNQIKDNVNKYLENVDNDVVLEKDARILDVIVYHRSISTNEIIEYIKCLIDKNESYFNIKEVLLLNPMCIYSNDDSLFDYVFNKMILDKELSIYYVSLLKLFYNPFIDEDKKEYYVAKLDVFSNIIKKEVCNLFDDNSSVLSDDELKEKYNMVSKNMFFNIPKEVYYNDDIGYVFTIDTYGTKYRDDAISVKFVGSDMLVGVHISDIAGFMEPGSVNDLICLNNFKKVYLGNGFSTLLDDNSSSKFSLNKNGNKKVVSLFMIFDKHFQLKDYKLVSDVVKINENLSFQKADNILKDGNNDNNYLYNSLYRLFILSNVLRNENKNKSNYWNHKYQYNNESYDSKIIIDELSVLYNYLVAKIFTSCDYPFVYRCQDEPYYGDLLGKINSNYDFPILNNMFCFSRYSIFPEYHYGLDKECYCHATSPLRRYPDLFDQYLMHMYLFNDKKIIVDDDLIKDLVDYFNIRNEEIRLFKAEHSNGLVYKKGHTPH